jgi:glucuronate isomerase
MEKAIALSQKSLEESAARAEADAARIFDRARNQQDLDPGESDRFSSHMLHFFGELNASKGWTMQLHIGALRNTNSRLFKHLGRDIGCDSIGESAQVHGLIKLLDQLDAHDQLPKVVLYNLNPSQNRALVAALGNFQRDLPGKLQYGSAWWFLDTEEGMIDQLNALSSIGLLSHFVGMLTDSRSFLSATRHEYFRRILCNLLGRDMQRGALPDDLDLIGAMVHRISYHNAVDYFGMKLSPEPIHEITSQPSVS